MNGAECLLRTLVKSGVQVCFTNPGTSEMQFVAAFDKVRDIRAILGLFEGVVSGAADGYARMADKPAATLLHLGPGLANALANFHNARKARVPIINIVGEALEPGTALSQKGQHPIFVTDYFTELCPLAKKKKDNPYLSDRFELYIGGMEIANGYSELNDPTEQRVRLLEELKDKGKEATSQVLDEDFVLALEHGMPSAGGLGIGIDRLIMILTGQVSIREVILFPQLKAESLERP